MKLTEREATAREAHVSLHRLQKQQLFAGARQGSSAHWEVRSIALQPPSAKCLSSQKGVPKGVSQTLWVSSKYN